MPFGYSLSRKRGILLGLLTIFIVFMGYVVYIDVNNYSVQNNEVESPTQSPQPTPTVWQPQQNGEIPPPYPNNPSDLPLVTNYTIIIPKISALGGFGFGGWTAIYINFTAPSLSLQEEEDWTINWTTQTLPFPFTTWTGNTSTISNSNMAEILPAVFNGTTINVRAEAYQNDGVGLIQFLGSKEWSVTEYVYSSKASINATIPNT